MGSRVSFCALESAARLHIEGSSAKLGGECRRAFRFRWNPGGPGITVASGAPCASRNSNDREEPTAQRTSAQGDSAPDAIIW